ncbi:MAG: winged helix-turn-helix transcriptional regulator [Candidatus Jordarchaeales archaeon]
MEEKEKLVLETLKKAGKPLKSREIAEIAKLDVKEVTKIIRRLKKRGEITSPKRSYYTPAK